MKRMKVLEKNGTLDEWFNLDFNSFDFDSNEEKVQTINVSIMNPSEQLTKGVNKIADYVKVTLGAKGKNVLFNDRITRKPRITKDGVTVAKQVFSEDPIEQMAIEIIREASERTVKTSGDGTTTTIVLAQHIVNEGLFRIKSGHISYYQLAKELDNCKDEIISLIKERSLDIDDNFEKLLHVATVSSTSEEIGEFIYDIIKEIGVYGSIEVKASNSVKDRIDKVKGIQFNKGFYAGQFVNDIAKMEWRHSGGVYVVIFDGTLRTFNEMMPYLSMINGDENDPSILTKNHPVLFIADVVEPTLLQTLVNTRVMNPGSFNIMVVEHDGFGDRKVEIMNDIAAMTGAQIGSSDVQGIPGFAEEVVVDEDSTSILGGDASDNNLVDELIKLTKLKMEDPDADEDDIKYYKRRLATLAGGVAVINVGAPTEVEVKEKKDRIDDAVEAVKAAIDRGISIGGGYTFIHIAKELLRQRDFNIGESIIVRSIIKPFTTICSNAGIDISDKLNVIWNDDSVGYDVITDTCIPLSEYKVYDPTGVLIDALTNAVAVAKSILSIAAAIYND